MNTVEMPAYSDGPIPGHAGAAGGWRPRSAPADIEAARQALYAAFWIDLWVAGYGSFTDIERDFLAGKLRSQFLDWLASRSAR